MLEGVCYHPQVVIEKENEDRDNPQKKSLDLGK
jgi:hypothetical protein